MYGLYENDRLRQTGDIRDLMINFEHNRPAEAMTHNLRTLTDLIGEHNVIPFIIEHAADRPEGYGYNWIRDTITRDLVCRHCLGEVIDLGNGFSIKPFPLTGYYYDGEYVGLDAQDVIDNHYDGVMIDIKYELLDELEDPTNLERFLDRLIDNESMVDIARDRLQ